MADEWIVSYDDIGSEIVRGQIVRCKECIHYHKHENEFINAKRCFLYGVERHPMEYCSSGIRRKDD